MRKITFGKTGIETSAIGFGCAQLTMLPDRASAVHLLESAFDCGITHFDVARLYGFGRTERILGEFLKGKRDRVTVTTKFGLQPPGGLAGNRFLIDLAKKILGPFPRVLNRLKQRGTSMNQAGRFSPEDALQSLETSLRELGTDHVDLWLLHECSLEESASDELIRVLDEVIKKGKVRAVGIASDFSLLKNDAGLFHPIYRVMQFNHNAAERNLEQLRGRNERALIIHSIFKHAGTIEKALAIRPGIGLQFAEQFGIDLRTPGTIGSLLLHYAILSNPTGVVIYSSTDPVRIEANVRDALSDRYSDKTTSGFLSVVAQLLSSQVTESHSQGLASSKS